MSSYRVFAPDGIGEVGPGDDLAALIAGAVAVDPDGPLADGDIVVVTSKVVSKAQGLVVDAAARDDQIEARTVATVARRGSLRIVRTPSGLVLAAAGIDNSNVAAGSIVLLPEDPDGSAEHLRRGLQRLAGVTVGVVISDTAGRAWRTGQTDHAIGAAGVWCLDRYAGRTDPYGNALQVTERAVADEIAAAADLAKEKLTGRPVAVLRGLGSWVTPDDEQGEPAAALVRPAVDDLFHLGTRESVVYAVLVACGAADRFEELVGADDETLVAVAASAYSGPSASGAGGSSSEPALPEGSLPGALVPQQLVLEAFIRSLLAAVARPGGR